MATITQRSPAAFGGRFTARNLMGVGILIAVIAWLFWNLTQSPAQFFQVAIIGLTNGSIYALVALGYTLVYGIIELINFAHGDLFMLGTVFSTWLLARLGADHSTLTAWLLLVPVLIATMAFCATINVTIERVAYKPLRNAPKLAPLITAIGMSFILSNIGLIWNGPSQHSVDRVLPSGRLFSIGGVDVDKLTILIIAITIPLLLILTYIVRSTKQGKGMRAAAQDFDAARLMGIDVDRTISFTFALGGIMAAAGGLMYAQFTTTTRWDAGFQLGLIAFTSAVLGGIGNLQGAVLGAACIGLIQSLNEGLPHALGAEWSQSVVFSILILILVFKPEGLLGEQTPEKV